MNRFDAVMNPTVAIPVAVMFVVLKFVTVVIPLIVAFVALKLTTVPTPDV